MVNPPDPTCVASDYAYVVYILRHPTTFPTFKNPPPGFLEVGFNVVGCLLVVDGFLSPRRRFLRLSNSCCECLGPFFAHSSLGPGFGGLPPFFSFSLHKTTPPASEQRPVASVLGPSSPIRLFNRGSGACPRSFLVLQKYS